LLAGKNPNLTFVEGHHQIIARMDTQSFSKLDGDNDSATFS